jgi:SecD/SecF fusion protein
MKGDSISSARVEFDQLGRPYVALTFGKSGARKFAMITADYAPGGAKNPSPEGRKYLAIILDGRLYSAPFIKTAIPNGQAIIEGNFSLAEAQALAIVLQSGSLPAPVEILKTSSLE